MESALRELKQHLAEIQDLRQAARVLGWDQHTMMPPRGGESRAEQLATLERLTHERFIESRTGRLLEALRPYEEGLPHDSDEASLIRVSRREYEKARRVPGELRAELTRAGSLSQNAWIDARAASDYAGFLPHLRRNLELTHRYIDCFEAVDEPYDILLDDYEEGASTAEVDAVFDELKRGLVPLIAEAADNPVDDSFLLGRFPVEQQRAFGLDVIRRFGFDEDAWRLDQAVHPFATSMATTDIRLTTRYSEGDLTSLFATMHECGHGLYERGVGAELERTPLCSGTSMSFHESQSRMWENLVGRSRPFWRRFYPPLQAAFPEQLGDVDENAFYRAVNKVAPSLIRVDADEATYNLHIILRFELERELLDGTVDLEHLPEAWNARMAEYLGIAVPDDARGVLQDVHWAAGSFGYFPTYSLGNVVSVQLWKRALETIPDLPEQIERGEFGALRHWLEENVHRHGRKFTPRELMERVVGGPIDPVPYLRYLEGKLGEVHGVAGTAR